MNKYREALHKLFSIAGQAPNAYNLRDEYVLLKELVDKTELPEPHRWCVHEKLRDYGFWCALPNNRHGYLYAPTEDLIDELVEEYINGQDNKPKSVKGFWSYVGIDPYEDTTRGGSFEYQGQLIDYVIKTIYRYKSLKRRIEKEKQKAMKNADMYASSELRQIAKGETK